ncbi:MAG: hypothetical protein E6J90_13705 [Deltaproteobacteria bacterium]|nr:MAG: hypothetical protein E6J90_13705 [Deltaproteobacteria bacterium]
MRGVRAISELALHVLVDADVPAQEVDLELLGTHEIEQLRGVERGAMAGVFAQPAIHRLPLGNPMPI